jgi:4-hydroxythreonine-4-phosphate dehydrogenase
MSMFDKSMPPLLALVPGEPAGIGPELCVMLAQHRQPAHLLAYADPDTLMRAADALGLPLRLREIDAGTERTGLEQIRRDREGAAPGELALIAIRQPLPSVFGIPEPRNAAAVIEALHRAGQACLDGVCEALVTGPVHKGVVNQAGIRYTGTTELLAEQAGRDVVMMLANPCLRVALATTHLPLRMVADAITFDGLTRSLRILHGALRENFGIDAPRIAVLGLNPHAGEQGYLGREEIDIIIPALDALRFEGMDLRGPLPADTAFLPSMLAECDAVLAMYHDQGLPVLKHAGFADAVNITLGLPYARVAVDHGTALELAGSGRADPSSLRYAVAMAARMAQTARN